MPFKILQIDYIVPKTLLFFMTFKNVLNIAMQLLLQLLLRTCSIFCTILIASIKVISEFLRFSVEVVNNLKFVKTRMNSHINLAYVLIICTYTSENDR